MHRNIARAEFLDRLLSDLTSRNGSGGDGASRLLAGFAQHILKRADSRYLYRHRLTTLGAQLLDSLRWVKSIVGRDDVQIRAFRPTQEEHGYALEGRVVETLMPDQPFIFDTLKLYMQRHGVRVHNSLNVIFPMILEDGQLADIDGAADNARNYSYTRWYVDWPGNLDFARIIADLNERLTLSQAMVRDFHRMVRTIKDLANEFDYLANVARDGAAADCHETRDFLQWLVDDNFVFMGLSFYDRDGAKVTVDAARGRGAAAGDAQPSGPDTAKTLRFLGKYDALAWPIARVRKSPQETLVHRAGKVDEVIVRTFDDQGRPQGGVAIHGMFTFKGLGDAGSAIPILRRKLAGIIEDEQVVEGSYEYKALVNAFNALPVEYLFEAKKELVRELVQLSVDADASGEIQGRVVVGEDGTSAYAFVVLPKEHYSDELRAELQQMLRRELAASYADHRIHLGKFGTVALHFYLTGGDGFASADVASIERKLVRLGTPWTAQLREQLEDKQGEALGGTMFGRWRDAFPEGYTEVVPAEEAVVDIEHMERVLETGRVRFDLFPYPADESEALLRIYSLDEMLLTDILPVVDNFGIVVAEQYAFDVRPRGSVKLTVNTLRIERGEDDVLDQAMNVIHGLRAVFRRRMRSDRLNRLLTKARLTWQEVDLFRAYYEYSRQLGQQFAAEVLQKVLLSHASFMSTLAQLFGTRFDPDLDVSEQERAKRVDALAAQLRAYLDGVKSFEEDRVLRTYLNLVEATIRTNFYLGKRPDKVHLLSFKVDSSKVAEMPEPRPMFEIYVHHADVEGIHLRGGRVARGGLRWSDRIDDFRSEVLGLMATQMVKNALIVPVGAKGGFALQNRFEDFAEARREADRVYRLFIRGLLEITDNIIEGKVIPPDRVVRYDGDDPYLVVAADKGTAHLSDTANEVAASFDFWLGDAFASGGSVGYDHKEYGITAKGTWVCVRRHFMEMGVDPEKDEITVVGIGDMSGDVFGNGLISSRTMKLIGAFNHRHIFIDPDPDPERSFVERKRLFDLGRSQWTDYDMSTVSAGGGLYDRGAKAIDLSPQAVEALDAPTATVSGEELIRLILKADVDLLWNGGIGTYVKASTETHFDVGDKDNDRVRVDADELRCKVFGEGGNLGITMKGRVQYAHLNGRINLDAIDNSGGVDLSDHEVNLKTLLAPLARAGKLKLADRDKLLAEVAEEVCDLVLTNSDDQALAVSLDDMRSRQDIWSFARTLMFLRDEFGFSRRLERLPRGSEVMEHRLARRMGLLRPELSKLLSFSKRFAYAKLMDDPIGSREELLPFLEDYFPARVVEKHGAALSQHMLFSEIAATVQVNRLVATAGVTFFPEMLAATERTVPEITAVYFLAEELLGVRALRAELHEIYGKTPTEGIYRAHLEIERALAEAVPTILALDPDHATLGWRQRLAPVKDVLELLARPKVRLMTPQGVQQIEDTTQRMSDLGVPKKLAKTVAGLRPLTHAFPIHALNQQLELDTATVAQAYFGVGYGLGTIPLASALSRQTYRDNWDHQAVLGIRRSLFDSTLDLARLLAEHLLAKGGKTRVEDVIAELSPLATIGKQLRDVLSERVPVSAATVLSERLRQRIRAVRTMGEGAEG